MKMTSNDRETAAEDLDSRINTTCNQHVLCTASTLCYHNLMQHHNNFYIQIEERSGIKLFQAVKALETEGKFPFKFIC